LLLLSVRAALRKGIKAKKLERELFELPELIKKALKDVAPWAKKFAEKLWRAKDIYLIGRGIGLPVVLEGALKLKEITYIHAEGMPAGELKHGTLALIEEGTPLLAVVPPGETREKM
ncbi:MAG: SIS domain-containing protein, partial [Candidatus Hadarchaeales archaeon]